MFEALIRNLSLRRSAAGIYYELRTLRQMLEVVFEREGLELPSVRRARAKADDAELNVNPPTEEELAALEADRIHRDLFNKVDPGTTWRPDPNR
jgi:hypothetical protein